jgi:hypothetical protein
VKSRIPSFRFLFCDDLRWLAVGGWRLAGRQAVEAEPTFRSFCTYIINREPRNIPLTKFQTFQQFFQELSGKLLKILPFNDTDMSFITDIVNMAISFYTYRLIPRPSERSWGRARDTVIQGRRFPGPIVPFPFQCDRVSAVEI